MNFVMKAMGLLSLVFCTSFLIGNTQALYERTVEPLEGQGLAYKVDAKKIRKKNRRGTQKNKSIQQGLRKPVGMPENPRTVLETLYTGISGFGVPHQEELAVIKAGGEPMYGEITYQGLQSILDDLKLTSDDIFYDLGCGVGKVVTQVFLATPVKKSMGVELCKSRYLNTQKVRKKLADGGYIAPGRVLAFTFQDFVKADIKDATVVYVLCLDSSLILKAERKLSKLKKGLRVISLKRFPDHARYGFELVKEYMVPMSWMKHGSRMYLYKLVK